MNGRASVTPSLGSRRVDERVWSAATWSAPIVIQLVFSGMFVAMWLLGKAGLHNDTPAGQRTTFLIAMGLAVVISLVTASLLWRRTSPKTKGVGLAAAGSAAVVLIGGLAYAYWPL